MIKVEVNKAHILISTFAALLIGCNPEINIERTKHSNFPISTVVISEPKKTYYLSGVLTRPVSGDTTEIQALRVLDTIQNTLSDQGLAMNNVVQMRVYLTGETRLEGKLDFDGFNRAYLSFFSEPNYPARTVVQVKALPVEGAFVEIEVVALGK